MTVYCVFSNDFDDGYTLVRIFSKEEDAVSYVEQEKHKYYELFVDPEEVH